jgi:hypothetical protein
MSQCKNEMTRNERGDASSMAVVRQIRPAVAEPVEDPERANVVRLVEFLGPISPELVLVDPELAPRARAILPELPWNWQPQLRDGDAPIALPVAVSPVAKRFPWRRAVVVAALGAVTVVFFGLGWLAAISAGGGEAVVAPRPPAITGPAASTPTASPTATVAPARPKPKSPAGPAGPAAAPRFVWPVAKDAAGYRVAIFRRGVRIFERDVVKAALQVPSTWTYRGRFQSLTSGAYRWVVWPLLRKGGVVRTGPPLVSASYSV